MIEPGNIYLGDCLELMRQMPDKCVDAVITDPPYGIGMGGRGTIGTSKNACVTDYGIQAWDSERLTGRE